MSYYNKGDYPSASAQFFQFLKNYPTGPLRAEARLYLGVSEYKRRRYNNAYYHLKRIINAKVKGADEAQYYLSFIYGKWGRLDHALTSLRKVGWNYKESEFADDAAFYIGYYYDINGLKAKAAEEYQSFLKRFPKSSFVTNAIWRAGRIYYYNKDYAYAYETFGKAENDLPPDVLTEHCLFWKAMSALKLERTDDAKDSFIRVVKEFDHTYHSYEARKKLKKLGVRDDDIEYAELKKLPNEIAESDIQEMGEDLKATASPEDDIKAHVDKYYALMSLGFHEHAINEANYLISRSPKEEKNKASLLYYFAKQEKGDYRSPIGFAEGKYLPALRDGEISYFDYKMWELAYPKGFWNHVIRYSVKYNLDPYLVLAVIREESRFNPKVVSWARAHGLMQIIPSTGRGIARLIGIRPYHVYRLFEPETNIKMGCYYLSNLLKRFGGNPYLALAAYNGGPMRVKTWLGRWKRNNSGGVDIDEFVESIPFHETRRYVKKVMKSYNEYRRIYKRSSVKDLPSSQG
jgi:soluble lytic murein transglycosylase